MRIRLTKTLTGTLALGVGHGYEDFEAQSHLYICTRSLGFAVMFQEQ